MGCVGICRGLQTVVEIAVQQGWGQSSKGVEPRSLCAQDFGYLRPHPIFCLFLCGHLDTKLTGTLGSVMQPANPRKQCGERDHIQFMRMRRTGALFSHVPPVFPYCRTPVGSSSPCLSNCTPSPPAGPLFLLNMLCATSPMVLLLCLLAWSAFDGVYGQTLTRYDIPDAQARRALCNDGSPAIYYSDAALPTASGANILVWLMGGGFCNTVQTCAARFAEFTWDPPPPSVGPAR